jgi:hypothetical protein
MSETEYQDRIGRLLGLALTNLRWGVLSSTSDYLEQARALVAQFQSEREESRLRQLEIYGLLPLPAKQLELSVGGRNS